MPPRAPASGRPRPSRRVRPKPDPKPPGRKSGDDYGVKAFRKPPEKIDETLDAPLPPTYTRCGGSHLQHTGDAVQFQVEIPRTPIHRQFNIKLGCCADCGQRVRGRHTLQTSDAVGAAASQLGPDLQALITHLNKDAGLSHGKASALLKALWNINLTRGGRTQAMLRAACRVAPQHDAIVDAMPLEPHVTPDETRWRVGGKNAWLHVIAATTKVCCIVDRGRDIAPVQRVLGPKYAGVMVHDGYLFSGSNYGIYSNNNQHETSLVIIRVLRTTITAFLTTPVPILRPRTR